jgi:hypothetical protein
MTRDRIGTLDSPHPLETAIEQWFSFATGRHTCVSVKGATLRGLVSARKRASKQAWEIDCLINADEGDNGVLMSLLDQITEAAGRSGAMRLFLRLPADSESEHSARRSGFSPYLREQMFSREAPHPPAKASSEVRRRGKADPYPAFQIYSRVVPPEVRRIEGITFDDWAASQESLGRTRQYVLDDGGTIRGTLRVAGDGDVGRFEVLGDAASSGVLVEAALAKVANRKRAITIAPEYDVALARHLERRGFEPGPEFTVMARRTVRTVKMPAKVKSVVQTTFG